MDNAQLKEIQKQVNITNKKAKELLDNVVALNETVKKIVDEYENCTHIWFISKYGHSEDEDNFVYEYTCAKCHQKMFFAEKKHGIVKIDNTVNYYLNVEQDPSYIYALYDYLIDIMENPTDKDLAFAIETFVNEHRNNYGYKNDDFARKLKINPNQINKDISYGE